MPGDEAEPAIAETPESEAPPSDGEPAAAFAGGLADDPLALLQLLRSGTQDPVKLVLGALGGTVQDNPQVAVLLDAIEAQRGDDMAEQQREELREEIAAEQAEAVAQLAETARRTFAELEQCRSRIEALAAGLGACPHCFGSDLLCETCAGEGAPGSRLPQASEFEYYVRPAVDRVRAALREMAPPRPWPHGGARRQPSPPPNPEGAPQ